MTQQTTDVKGRKPTIEERAKARVYNNPRLNRFAKVLLAEPAEPDRHWHWLATAQEGKIVEWAKDVIALEQQAQQDKGAHHA